MAQGYFVIGYYYNTKCHFKQLPVGLKVLSDDMVHFLNIEIKKKQVYQNYLVALMTYLTNIHISS